MAGVRVCKNNLFGEWTRHSFKHQGTAAPLCTSHSGQTPEAVTLRSEVAAEMLRQLVE